MCVVFSLMLWISSCAVFCFVPSLLLHVSVVTFACALFTTRFLSLSYFLVFLLFMCSVVLLCCGVSKVQNRHRRFSRRASFLRFQIKFAIITSTILLGPTEHYRYRNFGSMAPKLTDKFAQRGGGVFSTNSTFGFLAPFS